MYSYLATFWIYLAFVINKYKTTPYYLKQFYEETTLHWSWISLPGFIKEKWLDLDLYIHNLRRPKTKDKQQ